MEGSRMTISKRSTSATDARKIQRRVSTNWVRIIRFGVHLCTSLLALPSFEALAICPNNWCPHVNARQSRQWPTLANKQHHGTSSSHTLRWDSDGAIYFEPFPKKQTIIAPHLLYLQSSTASCETYEKNHSDSLGRLCILAPSQQELFRSLANTVRSIYFNDDKGLRNLLADFSSLKTAQFYCPWDWWTTWTLRKECEKNEEYVIGWYAVPS